jgi:hypothetical protein
MTEFEAIEQRFTRLREFVLGDLKPYAEQSEGGNFAVVALVLSACDALGALRYPRGGDRGAMVLARCLPEHWAPVSKILYDALRNGLIHGYDPKVIVDKGAEVTFTVGWFRESRYLHMQFLTGERRVLYIDAPSLVESLERTFASIEEELRSDANLRDEFLQADRQSRVLEVRASQAELWRTTVRGARVAGKPDRPGTPSLPGRDGVLESLAGATGAMQPLPPTRED